MAFIWGDSPSHGFQTSPNLGWGQPNTTPSAPPISQPQATPQEAIEKIVQQIHRNSPYCRFRWIFYNKVDPADVAKYKRPDNIMDKQWEKAVENNPDPTCMVPVPAVGFKDLYDRAVAQNKTSEEQAKHLENLRQYIKHVKVEHDLKISVKLEEYKQRQLELKARLLKVLIKLEGFRCKGYPIQPSEEQWRSCFENLQKELNSPNEYKAKLNELRSAVQMQEDRGASTHYGNLDEEDLQKLASVLEEQTKELMSVVEDLKSDLSVTEIMAQKYKESLPGSGTRAI